jgi:LacI family transcriptional regulator
MANIKDVARLAGVSTATVSKYLNGVKLKEKNKNAVAGAISETGYKLNSIARGLRTNKSMTVGILIHEIDNLFAAKIVSAIENILLNKGYSTIICDYRSEKELELQKLNFLTDKMADGIIYIPTHLTNDEINRVDAPLVIIDRMVDGVNADFVLVDNFEAARSAVTHLIENGHKNIGVLCGPTELYTFRERRNGCIQALSEKNLSVSNILSGNNSIQNGRDMSLKLLENNITALFAASYELTLGAVIALNEKNLNIKSGISFIGFDNLDIAGAVKPRLSIVAQPIMEIAETAAALMLDKLQGGQNPPKITKLKTSLILADSVMKIYTP